MFDIDYLRSFRLYNFAIIDFVATFLAVWIVGSLLSWLLAKVSVLIPIWSRLLWAVPIAILAHWIFGVTTPLTTMFLDPSGGYLVKILIVGMTIGGFCGISVMK